MAPTRHPGIWAALLGAAATAVALGVGSPAVAARVRMRVEPACLPLGDQATLVVEADGQTDRAPRIPAVPGLDIQLADRAVRARAGPATVWTYRVTPLQAGHFVVPAVAVAGGASSGAVLDVTRSAACATRAHVAASPQLPHHTAPQAGLRVSPGLWLAVGVVTTLAVGALLRALHGHRTRDMG